MLHQLQNLNSTDFYVLFNSLILIGSLFFVGRSITGNKNIQAIQIPVGMFVIYVFFIFGSLIKSEFSILNVVILLFLLTLIGIWRARSILFQDLKIIFLSFIFIFPLLIFGVLSHDYLWDDYTNWIPPARYLYINKHLPTLSEPIINNVTASYPYLRALIHSIINLPMNEFIMNIQIVSNFIFGSSIFFWASPICKVIYPKEDISIYKIIKIMGSFLCFLIIIWVITLDRFLFSSYSEATYLICLLHLFFYLIFNYNKYSKLNNEKFDYLLSILLTIPLLIKEIGFYHSLIIFFSYLLVFEIYKLFKNDENYNTKIKILILKLSNLIPLFLLKFLWSYYVEKNQINVAFNSFILDDKLSSIPKIFSSATFQFLNNFPTTSSIIIIIFFFLFSHTSKIPKLVSNKSQFLFVFLCSMGFILLTFLAYILIFTPFEANRAASFSRYLAPVSFLLWSSIIIATINSDIIVKPKIINYLSIIIISTYLLTIYININKYSFNENNDDKYKEIAMDIVSNFPKNEPLYIIDLQTNGIDAVKIRYYINEYMRVDYFASVHLTGKLNKSIISNWFDNYKNIHIHSASNTELIMIREFVDNYKK